jgi:hypothetical protein
MPKNNESLVSIIIANYNGFGFLDDCLRSVLETNYPNFDVILVDNGSEDRSFENAQMMFSSNPRIFFVKMTENLGFAVANNVGFMKSKGDYVVFLNNDVKVDPEWLNELLKAVKSRPNIGAAQSKLLRLGKKNCIDSAGDYVTNSGFAFSKGRGQKDSGQFDQIEDIFSARGAAMMVERELFKAVGFFDPLYFLQYEDIDLGWRIRLRGYRIVFAPKSIVFHASGKTLSQTESSKVLFHLYKGHLLTIIKNYELKNLFRFNPLIIIVGGLRQDIFQKNASSFLARVRVLSWLLLNLHRIIYSRRFVQTKVRRVPDSAIMRLMGKKQ